MDQFFKNLDVLYEKHDLNKIEDYFVEVAQQVEPIEKIVVLNEYIGFLRETSQFEKGKQVIEQIFSLSKECGIQDSVELGTILLNIATFLRAAKEYEQANVLYEQINLLYKDLDQKDYRLASFYNNYGLYFLERKEYEFANQYLLKALDSLDENSIVEIAITYTNLSLIAFETKDIMKGIEYSKKAIQIFEENHKQEDSHYAAALSGLAQAYYYQKDYINSYLTFNKSLKEIEKNYGTNTNNYQITKQNLDYIASLLHEEINGMELSKMYYELFGKEMIHTKFKEYENRIAIGVVGEGSECIGIDDEISKDHDFGCGFCMFLSKDDYEKIGNVLQKEYEALPSTFLGFSKLLNRRGVIEIESFFPILDWNTLDDISLLNVTNGEIFRDDSKVFTNKREFYKQYPEIIRKKKLAYALFKAGQAGQYNYFRMKNRNDEYGMYQCKKEFVDGIIDILYLLNQQYKPIYKWIFKKMDSFTILCDVRDLLKKCVLDFEEEDIEIICMKIVEELNKEALSTSKDPFLVNQRNEVWKNL